MNCIQEMQKLNTVITLTSSDCSLPLINLDDLYTKILSLFLFFSRKAKLKKKILNLKKRAVYSEKKKKITECKGVLPVGIFER